jgi:hypothetical protein
MPSEGEFLCVLIGAATSVSYPLFAGAPPADVVAAAPAPAQFVWNTPFFLDMLILFCLGVIGGLLSLVGLPIPVRDFKGGMVRVLVAGAFAALATGLLLSYLPVNGANPAVRCGIGAFMGFISYPGILWLGKYGMGWLLRRLGLEDKRPEDRQ